MLNNRTNFFAVFYLIAIILYISQGALFEGTWYTFLSGLYILSYNMFALLKVLVRGHRNKIFSLSAIIIGWMLLLWLVSPKSYMFGGNTVSTISMVQFSTIVFSSVFSFYYISINSLIRKYHFKTFVLFLGVINVYNVLNFDVATSGVGDYDFSTVNNEVYSIVALFPLLSLFWDKKWFMLLLMTMAFFFVSFCLKRGAILITAVFCVISIVYVYKSKLNKRLIQLSILTLVIGVVYAFMSIYNSDDKMQVRIEQTLEGDSSGRDDLYAMIWRAWEKSNLIEQIMGHGPLSTRSAASKYAHNDWLEILFDFGLIGLLLYVGIIYYITTYCFKRRSLPHIMALLMCLSYIILRSSFSMCFYELDSLLVFGFIGFIMGENDLRAKGYNKIAIY